jgi:hypothetical protein
MIRVDWILARSAIRGTMAVALWSLCYIIPSKVRAASQTSEPAVYYVGVRGDRGIGSGTLRDPYNGNTPERIFAIFHHASDGAKIVFAPGVYNVGRGIALGDGKSVTIQGSGRTKTILRLAANLPSGTSRAAVSGGVVLNLWATGGGFTRDSSLNISDLTLDANVGGSPRSTNFTADALHTNYPTVLVERVNIIGCGGSENYPTESFHVAAWYPNPDNSETRMWPWYQRFNDVHVTVSSGDAHTATVFAVGTATGQPPIVPFSGYSIVENCVFDVASDQDDTYAVGLGSKDGTFFQNNFIIVRNRATAMNSDSWDHRGISIERNKFYLFDRSSGIRMGSGPDPGTFRDDSICDNQFFVASSKVAFVIQLNGITHINVQGNYFLSSQGDNGVIAPIVVCNKYALHKNQNLVICDNWLDTKLFRFPIVQMEGEPKRGVIKLCTNNRSIDGTEGDGPSNGLTRECNQEKDEALTIASAEIQILNPEISGLKLRLPEIADYPDGSDKTIIGKHFCLVNDGKYSLRICSGEGEILSQLMPGCVLSLMALPSKTWIALNGEFRTDRDQ